MEYECPQCKYPHIKPEYQYCPDCGYNLHQFSSEDADDGFTELMEKSFAGG